MWWLHYISSKCFIGYLMSAKLVFHVGNTLKILRRVSIFSKTISISSEYNLFLGLLSWELGIFLLYMIFIVSHVLALMLAGLPDKNKKNFLLFFFNLSPMFDLRWQVIVRNKCCHYVRRWHSLYNNHYNREAYLFYDNMLIFVQLWTCIELNITVTIKQILWCSKHNILLTLFDYYCQMDKLFLQVTYMRLGNLEWLNNIRFVWAILVWKE